MGGHLSINRRTMVQGMGAIGLAGWLPSPLRAEEQLSVGFLYVGSRGDFGYNQAHAQAAELLKKMPNVNVHEVENVPETPECQRVMSDLIAKGAKVIFATSYGYLVPHVLKMASLNPAVDFLHCGGVYQAGKFPTNVGSYFSALDEGVYLAGMTAGGCSQANKAGFIAAKPIVQVLRNVNAFTLGARKVNPNLTVRAVFTGDWSKPATEVDMAKKLIKEGCDVITFHVDSPSEVIRYCESQGVMVCGYHTDQTSLAPRFQLTGTIASWSIYYGRVIEQKLTNAPVPRLTRGGLFDGMVSLADFGPLVPEPIRQQVNAEKERIKSARGGVFVGPLATQKGLKVLESGKIYHSQDPELDKMVWLVEGVVGGF